ncbi:hypothetical protein AYR66_13905 [Noviherbaspirillum denitrificans]|uniref:Lipoprotein n=1 Tax=Noviherbaspirillum denitrificans TaxID=1968433 RepID=A0A254TCM8_9BURK|nr:hypothetical protein AYR66_13905 [Noviherbaspirillum denitrificans]
MKHFNTLLVGAVALLLVTACDKAVRYHISASYVIKGNPDSALYPLEVKESNEDVLIRLKKAMPVPEVVSLDADGHEVPFYFTMNGDTLLVPAKFDHLQLRYKGSDATDILKKGAAK